MTDTALPEPGARGRDVETFLLAMSSAEIGEVAGAYRAARAGATGSLASGHYAFIAQAIEAIGRARFQSKWIGAVCQ